jgi:hypothetical protein
MTCALGDVLLKSKERQAGLRGREPAVSDAQCETMTSAIDSTMERIPASVFPIPRL